MMKQIPVLLVVCLVGTDAFFFDWLKPKVKQQSYNYYRPGNSNNYPQNNYKVPVWQAIPSGYVSQPVQTSYGAQQSSYGAQQTSYGSSQPSYGSAQPSYGSGAPSYNAPSSGSYAAPSYPPTSNTYSAPAPPSYPSSGSYASAPIYSNGVSGSYTSGSSSGYSQPAPATYDSSSGSISYNNANSGSYFGGAVSTHDGSNSLYGNTPEYTGPNPLISVPVYFPKSSGSSGSSQTAYSGTVPIPSTYSNGVSGFYDASVAGSSNAISIVQSPASAVATSS